MIKENKCHRTYSQEFKLGAVLLKIKHGLKPAMQKVGITDRRMLQRWVKAYHTYGKDGLIERRGRKASGRTKKLSLTPDQELRKCLRRLEMENEILKKLWDFQRRGVLPK